jgi:hypothetical protein
MFDLVLMNKLLAFHFLGNIDNDYCFFFFYLLNEKQTDYLPLIE